MKKDNVVSITTLAGTFADEKSLQTYCDEQFKTIKILSEENNKLKEEINHLKFLVASTTEILGVGQNPIQIIVSNEQALLEAQINLIQKRSMTVELSLEDTKRLDLLLKNLKLVKELEAPTFKGESKPVISDEKLLELASKKYEQGD